MQHTNYLATKGIIATASEKAARRYLLGEFREREKQRREEFAMQMRKVFPGDDELEPIIRLALRRQATKALTHPLIAPHFNIDEKDIAKIETVWDRQAKLFGDAVKGKYPEQFDGAIKDIKVKYTRKLASVWALLEKRDLEKFLEYGNLKTPEESLQEWACKQTTDIRDIYLEVALSV